MFNQMNSFKYSERRIRNGIIREKKTKYDDINGTSSYGQCKCQ